MSKIDGSALAVLGLKSQITSTKLQINLKFQYSKRGASACAARDQNLPERDIVWIFEFRSLFDICDLIFVIFELPTKRIPSGDKKSLVL
jgi:hypothetical protein